MLSRAKYLFVRAADDATSARGDWFPFCIKIQYNIEAVEVGTQRKQNEALVWSCVVAATMLQKK